MASVVDYYY